MQSNHNTNDAITTPAINKSKRLRPLIYVFAFIALFPLLRQELSNFDLNLYMMDFMGVFFLVFGLFKLIDLRGFANGFQMYDLIAKRFISFGYAFPFVEIILGIMYLSGFMFIWQNIITLIIATLGIYSAYAVIKKKEEIQCVCLGTIFDLPMTKVTLIENGVMFVMALFMILM